MNNVLEITNDFSFNTISLANPTQQTGGSYFTKASLGSYSKNIYLQLPKCQTKQGIIKNNTKMYCDLMFNNNEKELIEWFEKFESICQKKIYDNKDLWFHNSVEMNDIEEMMNPIMRSYRSGKNILIRTHIKNSRCVAFDENERTIHLEELKAEDYIIPLINIDGIKFTSKDFKIEIYLTQIMVLIPQDEFEKTCLIKIETKNDKSKDLTKTKDNLEQIDKISNFKNNKEILIKNTDNNNIENNDSLFNLNSIDNLKESENLICTEDNSTLEDGSLEYGSLEKSHLEKVSSLEKVNSNKDINDLQVIDLDVLDISDVSESVDLKKPNEVYYEIYKSAKKKAKELRQNSIQAYLEAKNIKIKYGLDQLDDSDEESIDFFETK